MTLATFQKFCSEFEVTFNLLSKIQLAGTFKKAKFGLSEAGEPYSAATSVRLAFPGGAVCSQTHKRTCSRTRWGMYDLAVKPLTGIW
jgi:hypothetical protein